MTLHPAAILVQLRVTGAMIAVLVLVNLIVPRRFHWREELARLSLINREIFQAHAVFLVLTLAMMSTLLLTSADALLVPGRLSRALLTGLAVFWGLRMAMQWWFYSPETWRGSRFNTLMHIVFSTMWIYMTAVFGMALWLIR